LLQRVLTSELDESVRSPLVNLVETYFPLNDEEWKRFRQLIAREEYRGMQDVELTYFDKLRQEGLVRGKQETLKRLLAAKFGPLPSTLEARIDTIDAVAELDDYLLRLLSAGSLAEMGLQG
jgi:hypothetical protein